MYLSHLSRSRYVDIYNIYTCQGELSLLSGEWVEGELQGAGRLVTGDTQVP